MRDRGASQLRSFLIMRGSKELHYRAIQYFERIKLSVQNSLATGQKESVLYRHVSLTADIFAIIRRQ